MIDTVVSHYEIIDEIGSGGMGVVYKARDTRLDRFVALKFLPPQRTADQEARERFMREAKTAASTEHPNICSIYEIDESETGQLFVSMPLYDGSTLKAVLKDGPLPESRACSIAVQIAEGLAHAHRKGVVHRDIKPSNILVTAEGGAIILDFGIAKLKGAADLTKTSDTLGTLHYMSPEQARGEDVDERADIWSLGVVLFEMLTGSRPFEGMYDHAVMYSLVNDEAPSLRAKNSGVSDAAEQAVLRCLQKDPENRFESAEELAAALWRVQRAPFVVAAGEEEDDDSEFVSTTGRERTTGTGISTKVFVSYKRNVEPDESLANRIQGSLGASCEVFIDKQMHIGARWVRQIEAELASSDYLIVLLSGHSVHSEMVLGEVEMATRLYQKTGRPSILPIRVAYEKEFAYPLSAHLNDVNWAVWRNDSDTESLVSRLKKAILAGRFETTDKLEAIGKSGDTGPIPEPLLSAQPTRLETPEGTMDPQSALYVVRPEDEIAQRAVRRQGVTITIKGPRQMGKSSLLIRTMAEAAEVGKQVVFLDFQLFDHEALSDASTFFRQFSAWITDELEVEDRIDEFWSRPLGNSQLCTRYMGRHVLKAVDQPVFLAMDEVERVFDTPFRSDFFSMLRSWHNDRAIKPAWKRLDLALVTSTEPYQLIQNLNQSPFNVGEVIELTDFTPEQGAYLNGRHGAPFSADQLVQLTDLLGGHPYLTRKALFMVATERMTAAEVLSEATDERGPFGDHLRHHLFRLHENEELVAGLKQVLRERRCSDENVYWRLRGAGLIRRQNGSVVPRCSVYEQYFIGRLHA